MIHIQCDKIKKRLKLICKDAAIYSKIITDHSTPNPACRFSDYASPEVSIFSLLGSFQSGHLINFIAYIRKTFPDIKLTLSDEAKSKYLKNGFDVPEILVQPKPFNLRPLQEEAVKKAMKFGFGNFDLCTSFGKSASQNALIANIWETTGERKQALIVVPNVQLVTQFYNDILEYGNFTEDDVCMFSGSVKNPSTDKKIIISNTQYIQKHFDKMPQVELLLIDEIHTTCAKGSKLYDAVCKQKIFDTPHIWGFSGTFPEDKIKMWGITGLVGPMMMSIKAHELQATGDVAMTVLKSFRIVHNKEQPVDMTLECPLERAKSKYPLEYKEIEDCLASNIVIVDHAFNAERNSFILFDHTIHGQNLMEIAEAINDELPEQQKKQLFYIDGSINIKYRDDMKKIFEDNNNCIVIGNKKCIGTGLSIKNVSNILFAFTSGSSVAGTIQTIGRSLRVREDKDTAYIFDFYHDYQYSSAHYLKRIKHYKNNYRQVPEEYDIHMKENGKYKCFLRPVDIRTNKRN